MQPQKYLEQYWNSYIHENYVYLAVPQYLLEEVRQKGLSPKKTLWKETDLEKLWVLLFRQRFQVNSNVLKLAKRGLEFTPNPEHAKHFADAFPEAIFNFTQALLEKELTLGEKRLVMKLQRQAALMRQGYFLVRLRLSHRVFRKGIFLLDNGKTDSIVGSFAHFKKKANEEVLKKVDPYLVRKKPFIIQVKNKIPKEDLELIV